MDLRRFDFGHAKMIIHQKDVLRFALMMLRILVQKRQDWKTDGTDGTDRNGFLPPAAGRDEPKVGQSPFQSV